VLDVDGPRAGAERFRVEVGQDQAGLGPEGQADVNEGPLAGVEGTTRFDLQMCGAL
jgi:hypothetical protein